MKASDILALSKAGYTSAQIALIAQGMDEESKEQPAPQPEPKKEDPKPAPQPELKKEDPKPAPQPEVKKEDPKPEDQPKPDPGYAGVMAELQKLNQTIYAANIRNSSQPEPQSAEDIIAQIIRPTLKKEE